MSESTYRVIVGDCLESMRNMSDQSVHCCVTSPPYFGLRDYGVDGQIGLEPTPEEFVQALVEVFREVRRVLRNDGTLWLNLGDSYAQQGGRGEQGATSARKGRSNVGAQQKRSSLRAPEGFKPKDLIGIPWRVAFALQADGWYLRQDIIWHKPNPMPESVRDRCTKAHEYIFLLSKGPKYYFNAEAIKEPATKGPQRMQADPASAARKSVGPHSRGPEGFNHQYADSERVWAADGKRNKRSVWSVTAKPFKGAHFATFPPDLVEPCILAGCPAGGTVLDPFGGSGTTAGVALAHGRNAILCELNPEYVELVPARVESVKQRIGAALATNAAQEVEK